VILPDDVKEEERRIHRYLDGWGVNQINISEYLNEKNRIVSTTLSSLFIKKQLTNNLLERRKSKQISVASHKGLDLGQQTVQQRTR
jgi:hypothetical protein